MPRTSSLGSNSSRLLTLKLYSCMMGLNCALARGASAEQVLPSAVAPAATHEGRELVEAVQRLGLTAVALWLRRDEVDAGVADASLRVVETRVLSRAQWQASAVPPRRAVVRMQQQAY
jgi:hypothetical protein